MIVHSERRSIARGPDPAYSGNSGGVDREFTNGDAL